jgi:DNA-binding NarL/FixJ family response regulator
MQQNFIHIAIVEDDPEVRASLCALIKSTADFVFEGEYGTAEMFNTDIDSIHLDIHQYDIRMYGYPFAR